MKLLSIDVGIKNLSFCIFEILEEKINIIDWKNIDISSGFDIKKQRNELLENIPKELDKVDNVLAVDDIIIENQPCLKNPIMKTIQIIIYSYFLIKGLHSDSSSISKILFYSANNKLKFYDGPEIKCELSTKYARSKFLGKVYTKYYLKDNKERLEFFNSNKKKDDLADCFLQGLSYIKTVKKIDIKIIL